MWSLVQTKHDRSVDCADCRGQVVAMRLPAKMVVLKAVAMAAFLQGFCFVSPAQAAIDNAGVMDSILERYSTAVASWASIIIAAASWLFWTLVVISMVWTFGMMALRKADIGDFFAEFVRFTVFTGFFWWLLLNGPAFANDIFDSLRQLAGDATTLGPGLSPSSIVDVGFAIYDRVLDQSALWSPVDAAIGTTLAGIILVLLALVSIKIVLLLTAGWVLAFGGVFFLGFGGSRWTSDFAVNYFKIVLALAAELMSMVLLVGIGRTFLDDYHTSMRAGITLKELGVMLIVALILFMVVTRIPPLIASVITGARVGKGGSMVQTSGVAPSGSPNIAMTAAATGGAAIAAGASNAAAGAQSLIAAFSNANQTVVPGVDLRYGLTSAVDRDYGGSLNGGGVAAASYTPFAAAAGFTGGTPAGDVNGATAVGDAHGRTDLKETANGSTQSGSGMSTSSSVAAGELGAVGGGWENQAGGFHALPAEERQQARQSHANWRAMAPDENNLGLEDYVSQRQTQQQERKAEIDSFMKRI